MVAVRPTPYGVGLVRKKPTGREAAGPRTQCAAFKPTGRKAAGARTQRVAFMPTGREVAATGRHAERMQAVRGVR